MTSDPRIVVQRFRSAERIRAERWLDLGRELLGTAPVTAAPLAARGDGERFTWQLTAANHRMLARSAALFADRAGAAADAAAVTEASRDELRFHLVTRRQPSAYGWYASFRGELVVTCARWFGSERSRRESIQLALSGFTRLRIVELEREPPAVGMAPLGLTLS